MRPHAPAVVVVAVTLAAVTVAACAKPPPPPPPPAPVVVAPPPAPVLDGAKVLAIVTENAPSVEVSIETRGGGDVGLELKGSGNPEIAIALLSSLTARLPGARASKLELDRTSWRATLATNGTPVADVTGLGRALDAARPAFTGSTALFADGVVEIVPGHVSFAGTLAPQRTVADAGAAVAPGFALTKVDAGPPFVLELATKP